jgi:CheY-like chemotaxis protein
MRILVAEDEQDIRNLYKEALEQRGHEVMLAEDGKRCLDVYESSHHQSAPKIHYNSSLRGQDQMLDSLLPLPASLSSSPAYFDVVILDYRMPNKDDIDVAKEILRMNPNQRIIFASAYVKETLIDSVKEIQQAVELIQKPFGTSELIEMVEDLEQYESLKRIIVKLKQSRGTSSDSEQIIEFLRDLRKMQKYRGTK